MRVVAFHYEAGPSHKQPHYFGHEGEARLSVEISGQRYQAQSRYPSDIPMRVIERQLQQEILQEVGKRLFG